MADGGIDPGHHQRSRFLLTQLLVMALPGIPAFYLPALLATPNDLARFRRTGHRRDLNRPQFRLDAIERRLQIPMPMPPMCWLHCVMPWRFVHRSMHCIPMRR
jgi:sucrose phosphorylase